VPQTSTAIVKDLYQRWGAEFAKRPPVHRRTRRRGLGGGRRHRREITGASHTSQMAAGRAEDADKATRRPVLMGPSEAGPVTTRSTTRERERQCAN
jgi:hypothetical protein